MHDSNEQLNKSTRSRKNRHNGPQDEVALFKLNFARYKYKKKRSFKDVFPLSPLASGTYYCCDVAPVFFIFLLLIPTVFPHPPSDSFGAGSRYLLFLSVTITDVLLIAILICRFGDFSCFLNSPYGAVRIPNRGFLPWQRAEHTRNRARELAVNWYTTGLHSHYFPHLFHVERTPPDCEIS